MKTGSKNRLRLTYMAMDLFTTSIAFFLFNIIRYNVLTHGHIFGAIPWSYILDDKMVLEQILVPLGLIGIYGISGYYNRPFPRSRLHEFVMTFYAALANSLIIFLIFLINDPTPRRRTEYLLIFLLFFLLLATTYLGRLAVTSVTLSKVRRKNICYRTVIVGNSSKSRKTRDELLRTRSPYVQKIVGFIRIDGENDIADEEPVFDPLHLRTLCEKEGINQIVIALQYPDDKTVLDIVDRLIDLDIPIKIAPDALSYATAGIRTDDILGNGFIDLTSPRMGDFSINIKRSFDFLISAIVLVILSPLMAVVALAVKLNSPGPAIYSQERVGKKHRPFRIYKFRSMRTDAESSGPRLSSSDDPRITSVGRFLRKYRIDELPQFYNVLRGDMSIVGPRPEREYFIRQIVTKVPYFSLVYQVKPGITSWAMVKFGYASDIDQMVERTKYDMVYITNMSVMLDLKIMIYTVKTVLTGKGV